MDRDQARRELTLIDPVSPGFLLERNTALVSINRVGMRSATALGRLAGEPSATDTFTSIELVGLLISCNVHPARFVSTSPRLLPTRGLIAPTLFPTSGCTNYPYA